MPAWMHAQMVKQIKAPACQAKCKTQSPRFATAARSFQLSSFLAEGEAQQSETLWVADLDSARLPFEGAAVHTAIAALAQQRAQLQVRKRDLSEADVTQNTAAYCGRP